MKSPWEESIPGHEPSPTPQPPAQDQREYEARIAVPPGLFAQPSNVDAGHLERAIAVLPEPIRLLLGEAETRWGLAQAPLMVAALHQFGAALGPSCRVATSAGNVCGAFNAVFCAEKPSHATWFDRLSEPWRAKVRQDMRARHSAGAAGLRKAINDFASPGNQAAETYGVSGGVESMNVARRLSCQLKPWVCVDRADWRTVERALLESHDGGVVLCPGGNDPIEELLSLGRKGQTALASGLEQSWRDQDIAVARQVPRNVLVHLGWTTHRRAARSLLFGRASQWSVMPPPVLLCGVNDCVHLMPGANGAGMDAWSLFVASAYDLRCSARMSEVWCLVPESLEMLEWFALKLAERLETVPNTLRRHFGWMPDLVVRLALLLAVGDRLTGAQPVANIIGPDEMSRAILVGWWFVQEHHDALQWVLGTKPNLSVDEEEDPFGGTDVTDRIALEEMILERLAKEGPLTKRELTRTFHKLSSSERDEALRKLVREGKVSDLADRRVALTEFGEKQLTMSASA